MVAVATRELVWAAIAVAVAVEVRDWIAEWLVIAIPIRPVQRPGVSRVAVQNEQKPEHHVRLPLLVRLEAWVDLPIY